MRIAGGQSDGAAGSLVIDGPCLTSTFCAQCGNEPEVAAGRASGIWDFQGLTELWAASRRSQTLAARVDSRAGPEEAQSLHSKAWPVSWRGIGFRLD